MRVHPRRPAIPAQWHPALRALIDSAAHECPPGHAEALGALTSLALRKAPARGVFDPAVRDEQELYSAIEAVARKHLDLADATRAWRRAVRAARLGLERQDEIERAALQLRTASDTAYFYAGLAFGLAYGYVGRRG